LLKFELNSNFVYILDPQSVGVNKLCALFPAISCSTTQVARDCGCWSVLLVFY